MIRIYTAPSCASCRKVKAWLKEHDIPYVEKNIFSTILREDELRELLERSENGTDDIISKRSKIIKDGSLTVVSNFSLTKSLKTLIISMLLSFFIVKFVKL